MGRCSLKALKGNSINIVLTTGGSNLQKLLRAIAHTLLFWLWTRTAGVQMEHSDQPNSVVTAYRRSSGDASTDKILFSALRRSFQYRLLSIDKPDTSATDTFKYDPGNPTPTAGGNNLSGPPAGPFDQASVEQREDVLVSTSAALSEATEVTGPVQMILYAASSAVDTIFAAKWVDVHPDGKAYNLCDGIIPARWRKSCTKPELIERGETYRYEPDMWVTSNLFKPGQRIRVEVSNRNRPQFDRNPNSGLPFGTDTCSARRRPFSMEPIELRTFYYRSFPVDYRGITSRRTLSDWQ